MLNVQDALDDVTRELDAATRDQAAIQNKIETLEAEKRGLELFLARHSGRGEEAVTANGAAQEWLRLSRTSAVLRVLSDHDYPLSPAEITERLRSHGRSDRRDPVAAALAYLKREGRVEHVGIGAWTVFTDPDDASSLNLELLEGGGP